jgi:hypothetical protein
MTMRRAHLLLLAASALALSACSETRDVMGLDSSPPDEFAVVDHPPLTMPPDYSLHPPRPGEPVFQAVQPSKTAAEALYGEGKMELVQQKGVSSLPSQNLSTSEQALITGTNATAADPRIRSQLDREATQQVVTSRRLMDNILFWREPKQAPATVVNAVAERQRIEAAKASNQPLNAGGGTPVVGSAAPTVP